MPNTLEEGFAELDKELISQDKAVLKGCEDPNELAVELHHTLGRYLRNRWGLWTKSTLARELETKYGIKHPDDMSHFILVRYCHQMKPSVWELIRERTEET